MIAVHSRQGWVRFLAPSILLAISVFASGCQAPRGVLNPGTIRASAASPEEQVSALERWRLSIDLANEFLASSFNRTLPAGARLSLSPEGMVLRVSTGDTPLRLVLIDEYRDSLCVCATFNTHEDEVYIRRPWGESADLPIATCNTFFHVDFGTLSSPVADLSSSILKAATILHYEKAAHISRWEWFKCQKLEWLIGSGHHRISMERAVRNYGRVLPLLARRSSCSSDVAACALEWCRWGECGGESSARSKPVAREFRAAPSRSRRRGRIRRFF